MQNPPPSGYGYPQQGYGPQGYGPPPHGYGYGGPPQTPRIPPTHPYATLAVVLGLFSFLTGPLTGVPAILLAARALRDITAAPERLGGASTAQAGRVLGWIGCTLGALYAGSASGRSSLALGVLAGLVGVAGFAATVIGRVQQKAPLASIPLPSVAVALALTFGSIGGASQAYTEATERAAACMKAEGEAEAHAAKRDFNAARADVALAKMKCDEGAAARLAERTQQIGAQERAWKKAEDERLEAQRVADAKKKEADAVATWPAKSAAIAAATRKAAGELANGKPVDADRSLVGAEGTLSDLVGTSIVDDKAWKDLSTQVTALRTRIDAQLAMRAFAAEEEMLRTLLAQYKNNEVRGDAQFKGRTVQFAGLVGDVKKDILNHVFVTVGTGEWLQIPRVQCLFDDRSASQTSSLNKGDRVRMRGTVKGLMMNVLVEGCEVVQ